MGLGTPRTRRRGRAPLLKLLRNSWMLALRADGKSDKTVKTYRDGAGQLTGFLVSPPPLPAETAVLVDSAQPVAAKLGGAWFIKVEFAGMPVPAEPDSFCRQGLTGWLSPS